MKRLAILIPLLSFCLMALTSCGKWGNLVRPEGGTYPCSYPGGIPAGDYKKDDLDQKVGEEKQGKEKFLKRSDEVPVATTPLEDEDNKTT